MISPLAKPRMLLAHRQAWARLSDFSDLEASFDDAIQIV